MTTLRSLNLLLGFRASPFQRWRPRSFISLPKILPLFDWSITASPQSRQPYVFPLPRYSVHVKALQVSSSGSEWLPAVDAAASPVVASLTADSAHKRKENFCQFCGGLTKQVIPDGDEKMRAVCTVCGAIHYENPKMMIRSTVHRIIAFCECGNAKVVGCLVEHDGKVLLCKRNIHPSYGLWTLPAGYLEIGESAAEGAMRETFEEANAEVEIISPFAQLDIPYIGQSYIIFRAKMKKPFFSPGSESLECTLFSLDDIPFGSLAFSSVYVALKMYAEDVKNEKLRFHYCIINKRPGASLSDPNGFDMEHHLHS